MLHYETISANTLELLKRIQSLEIFSNVRLVGGPALSLQLVHRKSIDLDLFGRVEVSLDEIVAEISPFASVSPISSSQMMKFLYADGVKIDIVNYPYGWIERPVIENGLVLAGIKDIAAMKLSAITNRGTKKDFIDFYYLLKYHSIDEMTNFYIQKYNDSQLFSMYKSLTYFADAETDPMPLMTDTLEWAEVKSSIISSLKNYM